VKRARANDYRRRLREKAGLWPLKIERIAFSAIHTLGEGEIPLLSPLSVLCGPNGVGKTTLLKMIWATLDPAKAKHPKSGTIDAGKATVNLVDATNKIEMSADFGAKQVSGELKAEVVYINTSVDVDALQDQFVDLSFDDITNGIGSKTLVGSELAEINTLTQRNYREVKLYEVELSNEVVPFFEVSFGPSRYDSRSMGSGEFAAFLLWWRLRRAPAKSILLIEEPECFLSPGSQAAFTDLLIQVMFKKKICSIVTSHSAEILTPLPQESIRFVRRDDSGVRFGTDRPSPVLLETIGIRTPVDVLAFVEDQAAARFCRLLIEHFDPSLSRRIEIVPLNGDGSIVSLLRAIDNHYKAFTLLGIFDGDLRGQVADDVKPKALFLPGEKPVELLFKELCEKKSDGLIELSERVNVGEILFALQARDHHDWFLDFAVNCGLEAGQLFMIFFRFWLKEASNESAARAAFEDIRRKIELEVGFNENDPESQLDVVDISGVPATQVGENKLKT
jgi:predicted ATPase